MLRRACALPRPPHTGLTAPPARPRAPLARPRRSLPPTDRSYTGVGRRFPATYLGDRLTAKKAALLEAIRAGDVAQIRMHFDFSWDFIFPPAQTVGGVRFFEGWCRSPLALLVRPDEGSLEPFMLGVSDADRLALIRDVLASGTASPNYPDSYWPAPTMHACFEGDVAALALLYEFGADLTARHFWLLQSKPQWSLVHAAAFNGNLAVLQFLVERTPLELLYALDADGNNALHVLLGASRDEECAHFLLDRGVDGFALNAEGRSPLSLAVERLPSIAVRLLRQKAEFCYYWYGFDLYRYSFDGVVLPANGSKALTFATSERSGSRLTLEQLIVAHKRKELLAVPIMRTLLERKWKWFARCAALPRHRAGERCRLAVCTRTRT